MTYRELGKARGISAASAARLAFRKGWQRQPGNDGAARVAVPTGEDQASPYDARAGTRDAATGEAPGSGAREAVSRGARMPGAELAIQALREQADQAERRADTERDRADRERESRERAEVRADAADADRRAADARADAATARADAAEGRAGWAEDQAAELRNRLDASEGHAAELRTALDAAEQARREAQEARDAAEATAAAMDRVEAERAARSLLRRLRDALAGR
jgi:hypothetical protein